MSASVRRSPPSSLLPSSKQVINNNNNNKNFKIIWLVYRKIRLLKQCLGWNGKTLSFYRQKDLECVWQPLSSVQRTAATARELEERGQSSTVLRETALLFDVAEGSRCRPDLTQGSRLLLLTNRIKKKKPNHIFHCAIWHLSYLICLSLGSNSLTRKDQGKDWCRQENWYSKMSLSLLPSIPHPLVFLSTSPAY